MQTQYHKAVSEIKELLTRNNCLFDYFEHEPVTTSEQAAQVRTGYTLKQGAKALIIRYVDENKTATFTMLVIPGDKRLNNAKVKKLLNTKDMRFANAEEIDKVTSGVKIGGIPPFGNLFGLQVYVDKSVFENEKIIFNAGDQRVSIGMRSGDYTKLVQPQLADII